MSKFSLHRDLRSALDDAIGCDREEVRILFGNRGLPGDEKPAPDYRVLMR